MSLVHRRFTYRLYASATQVAALERLCDLHRALYNSALQERIDAYRLAGKSIGYAAQCKSLTQIRRENPEYLTVNAQSLQVTLKRLDEAFQHFFRRVKEGAEEPGFPRYKGKDRFPGFGFKTHGDGFKFTPGSNWRHGKLRLTGIGTIKARGEARTPGQIVACSVMRKADGWYLSLVVACAPHRERTGEKEAGLDWGVETFATLAYGPDAYDAFANDRLLAAEQDALRNGQRALSRALRGRRSKRAAKQRRAMARRHRKVANRRKDRNHQVTARLVREHRLIVTEELAVKNMTASAKGTVDEPGTRVAQKAGLNRSILDTAPGSFLSMLRWKAEEAASELIVLDTHKHKPSQTCPCCDGVQWKSLSEREHRCAVCGFRATRDQASALTMLKAGLRLAGREPAWVFAPETPGRAA
jgi:putative transposase